MRWRQPLGIMLSGAVISLAMTAAVMLISGGYDIGRASGPSAAINDPMASARPLPIAKEPDARLIPRPTTDPVIDSNFPDPDMIKVGATYYAYATNADGRNLPIATAPAPDGPWTRLDVEGLPALGAWAETGYTWAPDVSTRPGGGFVLYYTARSRKSGRQCVGAAVSSAPTGPFTPQGTEPVACPAGRGDTLDAAAFTDTDGTRYLLYRSGKDVHSGKAKRRPGPTAIYLQRMSADGLVPQGPAVRILVKGPSDPRLVEAPALVRQGGRYVLFYSSGVFYDSSYRTSYATAESITGPYQKASAPLLSTGGYHKKVVGPGGAEVIRDQTGDRIVFHGIVKKLPGRVVIRGMYVADLGWDGARPVVRGPTTRYEAESGPATGAQIRGDVGHASGGRAVGYLDHPGSRLDLRVFAPATGGYALRIAYASRSAGEVRQTLTVNGSAAMALVYAGGRPGVWRTTTVGVSLKGGWNTLRFGYLTGSADLDYVEVT